MHELAPITMTIEELHKRLTELDTAQDEYFLHGLYGSTDDNEKLALTIKRGKYTIEYEVYYRERGEKHSVRTFMSEDDACRYMLTKLQG